jgi:hypothetical protein
MAINFEDANRVYKQHLGRPISQDEYQTYNLANVDYGVDHLAKKAQQSEEYKNRSPEQVTKASEYGQKLNTYSDIQNVYGDVLGREAKGDALDFYSERLQGGGYSLDDLKADLRYSPEYQNAGYLPTEEQNLKNINNPNLPDGAEYQPILQEAQENELMQGQNIDPDKYAQTAAQAQAPDAQSAEGYQATTISGQTPQGEAAQGQVSDESKVDAATREGAYEDYAATIEQARQEAAQFELDKRATVQHQYKQLMNFNADETPAWAKGAIREAESRMAARGLGASSMAGGAVSAAVMREALPIAQQDARAFQTMSMEKFNKRQQATLMKASHLANLDMQSLNNRQQAAVENSRRFLQMDMQNLNNRQQMAIMNTQSRVQALMSDQAAENAAKQFNAQSENEMRMFYDNLETQVETFNAAQTNTMRQFNSRLANQREQFNVKNQLLVEKSNVEYLRGISTRNTQAQNEANYVNSQNLLEISNTAMQNSIQLLRDDEAFAFEMSENAKDRVLTRWQTSVNNKFKQGIFDAQQDMEVGAAIASGAMSLISVASDNGAFEDIGSWFESDWDTPELDSYEF